jgi:hypothetical protein
MLDWLEGKKTYTAAIAAILLVVSEWLQAGVFDLSSIINLVQGTLPYFIAIFLRKGVSGN